MSWDLSNYNVERLFYFTKTERQGIIVLVVLVIGVYTIPALLQAFSGPEKTDPTEQAKSEKEYNEFISSIKEAKQDKKYPVYRGKYSSPAYPKKKLDRQRSIRIPPTPPLSSVSACLPGWRAIFCDTAESKADSDVRKTFGKYTG